MQTLGQSVIAFGALAFLVLVMFLLSPIFGIISLAFAIPMAGLLWRL